ncbi:MAG: hypothetical protein EOP00_19295 [Pedobacter sp.]|nr:MAG: hypothetical protein EOP00_19295 [Pedobacter sp.]
MKPIAQKLKALSLIILVTMCFTACEKQKINENNIVNYGTSFGMCVEYCNQSISITSAKVTFTKIKNRPTPDTKTCEKTIDNEQFKNLTATIDLGKFDKLDERIGCPDCADGGAEWVEVVRDGKKKRVTFEYGDAPKELAEAVAKFRELKASFANCN